MPEASGVTNQTLLVSELILVGGVRQDPEASALLWLVPLPLCVVRSARSICLRDDSTVGLPSLFVVGQVVEAIGSRPGRPCGP